MVLKKERKRKCVRLVGGPEVLLCNSISKAWAKALMSVKPKVRQRLPRACTQHSRGRLSCGLSSRPVGFAYLTVLDALGGDSAQWLWQKTFNV